MTMLPFASKESEYALLGESHDDAESHKTLLLEQDRQRRRTAWLQRSWFLFSILLNMALSLVLTAMFFRRPSQASCIDQFVSPSPAREAVRYPKMEYVPDRYEGPNKWLGPPSDEIDYQWKKVVHRHLIPIPEEIAKTRVHNTSEYWRIPKHLEAKHGSGLMGGMEFGHQLHCVNLLRKHSHFDYYKDDFDLKPYSRGHIDHCFDMLRQFVMCHADVGLYPMYWTEGREVANIDVANPKKCVDFDRVMVWAKEHEIGEENIDHFDTGTDMIWPAGQAPKRRQGNRFH